MRACVHECVNLHQDGPHSVVHIPICSTAQQLSEAALSQDHGVLLVVQVRVLTPHRGGGGVPDPEGRERGRGRGREGLGDGMGIVKER